MFDTAKYKQGSRLIVLLPEALAGNLELSRSVAQTARGRTHEVIYLAVQQNLHTGLQVTRSMVTMKAMTSDRMLNVSYRVVPGTAVSMTLRNLATKHDTIIIPQLCADHPSKFKFIPVRSKDWLSVKLALSYSTYNLGGSLH